MKAATRVVKALMKADKVTRLGVINDEYFAVIWDGKIVAENQVIDPEDLKALFKELRTWTYGHGTMDTRIADYAVSWLGTHTIGIGCQHVPIKNLRAIYRAYNKLTKTK